MYSEGNLGTHKWKVSTNFGLGEKFLIGGLVQVEEGSRRLSEGRLQHGSYWELFFKEFRLREWEWSDYGLYVRPCWEHWLKAILTLHIVFVYLFICWFGYHTVLSVGNLEESPGCDQGKVVPGIEPRTSADVPICWSTRKTFWRDGSHLGWSSEWKRKPGGGK